MSREFICADFQLSPVTIPNLFINHRAIHTVVRMQAMLADRVFALGNAPQTFHVLGFDGGGRKECLLRNGLPPQSCDATFVGVCARALSG